MRKKIALVLKDWHLWGIDAPCPQFVENAVWDGKKSLPAGKLVALQRQGLSNLSMAFNAAGSNWLLRVEQPHYAVDRERENQIQAKMSKLGLAAANFYGGANYSLRAWVAGNTGAELIADNSFGKQQQMAIIETFERLHAFDYKQSKLANLPKFDFIQTFDGYPDYLKSPALEYKFTSLQQRIVQIPLSICHMDPVLENWLITSDNKAILLDWEYANLYYRSWDVAQFAQSLKKHRFNSKFLEKWLNLNLDDAISSEVAIINQLWELLNQ